MAEGASESLPVSPIPPRPDAQDTGTDVREGGMDDERRAAILGLAKDLLFKRNQHLSKERVEELFFSMTTL